MFKNLKVNNECLDLVWINSTNNGWLGKYLNDTRLFHIIPFSCLHFWASRRWLKLCVYFSMQHVRSRKYWLRDTHSVPFCTVHTFNIWFIQILFVSKNFFNLSVLVVSNCFFLFKTLNHQHFLNYALLSLSSLSTFFLNVYWRRYIWKNGRNSNV